MRKSELLTAGGTASITQRGAGYRFGAAVSEVAGATQISVENGDGTSFGVSPAAVRVEVGVLPRTAWSWSAWYFGTMSQERCPADNWLVASWDECVLAAISFGYQFVRRWRDLHP